MQKRGEISIQGKEQQLADYLTKKGAPWSNVVSVLQEVSFITY